MNAARIVADHSTKRAVIVGCGIGSERQVMRFGRVSQIIQDNAGLDASDFLSRVEFQYRPHVLRHVEYHRNIAALTRQTRTAAARKNWRAEAPRDFYSLENIVNIFRNDDADRHLTIVGSVRRVHVARTSIESHFRGNYFFKLTGQRLASEF